MNNKYDTVENWKMFDAYKNKAISMINSFGVVIIIDPLGKVRMYKNNNGTLEEILT